MKKIKTCVDKPHDGMSEFNKLCMSVSTTCSNSCTFEWGRRVVLQPLYCVPDVAQRGCFSTHVCEPVNTKACMPKSHADCIISIFVPLKDCMHLLKNCRPHTCVSRDSLIWPHTHRPQVMSRRAARGIQVCGHLQCGPGRRPRALSWLASHDMHVSGF